MARSIFSSFELFAPESRDFSQAEKEKSVCQVKQIHKMTTIFTQNGPRLSFENQFNFPSSYFFLSLRFENDFFHHHFHIKTGVKSQL